MSYKTKPVVFIEKEKAMKKHIAILMLCIITLVSMMGCSSTEGEGTGDKTESKTEGKTEDEAADSGDGYVIGVSNNVIGNSWRAQFLKGVDDAREKLIEEELIDDIILVNCDSDLNQQLDDINALIQEGCDAILINAVSETALSEVIADAVSKGIDVYIINDAAAYEDTIAIIGDAKGVWEPVVRYFAESFPEEGGNYIYISGVPGLSTDTARTEVVDDVMAEYPNINCVGAAAGNYNAADTQEAVLNLLSANSGITIDGLLCQESAVDAAIAAFETAGVDYPQYITGDSTVLYYNKWYENFYDSKSCSTAFPTSTAYNACIMAAYALNGYEWDESKFAENPMDSNLKNAILMQSPYIVSNEKADGTETWLKGTDISKSTLLSIDETHEMIADLPDSSVFDRYMTDEELLSFFKQK